MPSDSSHAAPMLVRAGEPAVALERLQLGGAEHEGDQREAFLQNLVHEHPEIIPMADIEPAFMPLIPICRELQTAAGYVDNLWLTPEGGIVLGECKLFRNQQARREVIVQALDYARAVAKLRYLTKCPCEERTGSRYMPGAAILGPQRRSIVSSRPITSGSDGRKFLMIIASSLRATARLLQRA